MATTALEVADLYIKLRTNALALIPQFDALGRSGEAMAAKIKKASAATADATAAETVSARFKKAADGIALVGVAIAGVSIKMAADFQTVTTRLVTSAGEYPSALGMVRDGLLTMASDVGVSAIQLAKDMYNIESAGYHGQAGLNALKVAEQGAKAEGADATTVTDALSSALRDYYPHAQAAADVSAASATVMSKFIGATSAGKMTFQDLASSLSNILPIASQTKISLDDILGALASMTVHGESAQQSSQNLAHAIGKLAGPLPAQAKALALIGLDARTVSDSLGTRGLTGTVQMIGDAIQKRMGPDQTHVIINMLDAMKGMPPAVQEIAQKVVDGTMTFTEYTKAIHGLGVIAEGQASSFTTLAKSTHGVGSAQQDGAQIMQAYTKTLRDSMGDQTGMNVALMLTGQNADYTASAVQLVTNATADAQGNVKGWSEIQGNFNQKLSEAWAGLQSFAIQIGTVLLPVATKIAGVIGDVVGWLTKNKVAAEVAATVVGGALVVAFSALLGVFWGFVANPVTWIIAGIVAALLAMGAAVWWVIQHWDAFKKFLAPTAKWLNDNVIQPMVRYFTDLWQEMKPTIDLIVKGFKETFQVIVDWIKKHMPEIKETVKTVFEDLGKIILPILQAIGEAFKTAFKVIGDVIGGIIEFLQGLERVGRGIAEFFQGIFSGDLRKAWRGIQDIFGGAFDAIGGIFKVQLKSLADLLGGGLKVFEDLFKSKWAYLNSITGGFFDDLKTNFVRGFTTIRDAELDGLKVVELGFTTSYAAVNKATGGLLGDIKDAFTTGLSDTADAVISGWGKITGAQPDAKPTAPAAPSDSWSAGLTPDKNKPAAASQGMFGNLKTTFLRGFNDLRNDAVTGWNKIQDVFRSIPSKIVAFFKDVPHSIGMIFGFLVGILYKAGLDALVSLGKGIIKGWDDAVKWFQDLPGKIQRFFDKAVNWLYPKGQDVQNGLKKGVTDSAESTFQWFRDLPGKINRFFDKAGDWLYGHGRDLLIGLGRGIIDSFYEQVKFFQDLPGKIERFFDHAGTWLYQAGKNIIQGVIDGIASKVADLQAKVQSFADGIVKGFNKAMNINSPSLVMAKAAASIPEGVAKGIADNTHHAVNAAADMAKKVASAGSVAVNVGVNGSLSGGVIGGDGAALDVGVGSGLPMASSSLGGGVGGTQVINVVVNVAGTVTAEQDLQKTVQQVVVRYAGRNNGLGFTPAFSR